MANFYKNNVEDILRPWVNATSLKKSFEPFDKETVGKTNLGSGC